MHKLFISLLMILGLTLHTFASTTNTKAMPEATIKKMDRQMTRHKARTRNFNTHKEFKHKQKKQMKRASHKNIRYNNGQAYNNGYNQTHYQEPRRMVRQRGYRHHKRGWVLAYKYDRASFYDNEGYFYGYFNRYGYYFEDVFYRYDRYYSYRDRMRGLGLFSRLYYMPANAQYYGFEMRGNSYDMRHERGYQRDYSRY